MIRRQSGVSYAEALAATIIIAVTAVPVTNALRGALATAEADASATVNHYRLLGKLEEVLAEPFATVSAQAAGVATPTALSDTPGTVDRRLVFISPYDGDNADADNDPFTGTDASLLWVRVAIEGRVNALESLKSDQ